MEFYKTRDLSRKSRNSRDKSASSFRNSRQGSRDESHSVTCAECGEQCTVPFVPRTNKPVYCNDCFRNSNDTHSSHDESQSVTCAECGKQCTVPFVPRTNKPVYCNDCFRNSNDTHSSHDESQSVTCAECGEQCTVPFVPRTNKPVYCNDCFRKSSSNSRSDRDNFRSDRRTRDDGFRSDRYAKNDRDNFRSDRRTRDDGFRSDRYAKNDRDNFRSDRRTRDDGFRSRRKESRPESSSRDNKLSRKQEKLYSNGSDAFYASLREKLFTILGGKTCSSCGFKEEKALGISHMYDDEMFDSIRRGGLASSWGKYISEPELAKKELKVLCLNCNEIRQPASKPKQTNTRPAQKKSKYFPR